MDTLKLLRSGKHGRLWANSDGLSLLADCGLSELGDLESFQGGQVVISGSHRTVRRVESSDGGVSYLKQSFRGARVGLLGGLLRQGKRRSSCRIEADNLAALKDAGISAAEVVAYGEQISGLTEEFSFLLTRQVVGHDLSVYLADAMPEYRRSPAHDGLIAQALIRLAKDLSAQGFYFIDFVTKHIFVDASENEGPRLALIDVARLEMGKPHSAERTADMLARLNVSVPFAAIGTGLRARFASAVGGEIAPGFWRNVARRSEELLERRRYRYVLSPRPRPLEPALRRSSDGSQAWNLAQLDVLRQSGLNSEQCGRPTLPTGSTDVKVVDSDADSIKLLVNLHHLTLGWVRMTPLTTWQVGDSGKLPSWALWKPTGHASLIDSLSAASKCDLARMGEELGRVIRCLLTVGVAPAGAWCDWFFWDGEEILVEPLPPFTTHDLSADRVTSLLFGELQEKLGSERTNLVRAHFSTERPGLLGSPQAARSRRS